MTKDLENKLDALELHCSAAVLDVGWDIGRLLREAARLGAACEREAIVDWCQKRGPFAPEFSVGLGIEAGAHEAEADRAK